jgi:biotin operon repressor
MSTSTQNYRLYQLLKSAAGAVSKTEIAVHLGVREVSVPVYIHELKRLFKADIDSVRNGRAVSGYKLVSKELNIPQNRKNSASPVVKKAKTVKTVASKIEDGSIPVPDKDLEVTQISDREFADIRSSLGVDFGSGRMGGEY